MKKLDLSIDERYAELIGLMMGDGCLSHTNKARYIYICGHKKDDLEYHQNTTKVLFKELFEKDIEIKFRKKENTLFIKFSDKDIFNELCKYLPVGKKYDYLQVPGRILSNKKLFFAFLRGLVDTDGCIIFSKQHRQTQYYPRIELSSRSKQFLLEILEELKRHEFYGSVSHKGKQNYRMEVPGKKNPKKWMDHIGFSNPTKLRKVKSAGIYTPLQF